MGAAAIIDFVVVTHHIHYPLAECKFAQIKPRSFFLLQLQRVSSQFRGVIHLEEVTERLHGSHGAFYRHIPILQYNEFRFSKWILSSYALFVRHFTAANR